MFVMYSGEYRCNCKQFVSAKFCCAHTMLMVLANDEIEDFRAFVYREVDRPLLPGQAGMAGGRRTFARGRPRAPKRQLQYQEVDDPDYVEDQDDQAYEDYVIDAPSTSKRTKSVRVFVPLVYFILKV